MDTRMDSRIFLGTLFLFVLFLSVNAAPIHNEMTEDFPSDRECFYQTQYYPHGTSIETEEPCLNCTCNKGVLVCFLRVCHNLVAPKDSDCEVRKSEGQCCAELVCGVKNPNTTQNADVTTPTPRLSDLPLGSTAWWTSSESASEDTTLSPTDFKVQDNAAKSGCRQNGSIYAEGSAMPSSAFCEYCYCIKGHQRCIRPQCHLHIDECKPIYRHDFSCCPTAYTCSKRISDVTSTPSTTTAASVHVRKRLDCHVNGTFHKEGDVVFNEDVCQNCFCVKGEVRCSTTTCALKLDGCQPIIQPGKCCPTGYNCVTQSTTQASEENESSNTEAITSYFDNAISSTASSTSEFQEAAYEARTSEDTLLINATGSGNDTIATRDNDRNILEADTTTVAADDEASEIASATLEYTESNDLIATTIGNLDSESSGRHNVEATSNLPAETEDSSSSLPTAEEKPSVTNFTEDIAEERTYPADAANVTTTLPETSQTLNSSADEAGGLTNDTILESKAAVTGFNQLPVNETLTEVETNSTDEYASKNASESNGRLPEVGTYINSTTLVIAAPLSDNSNATALVGGKDTGASENNSSSNGTADVTMDPTHGNETNDILEERHDIHVLTTEITAFEEDGTETLNSSSSKTIEIVTHLNDRINNHSIVARTDVDENVTQVSEVENHKNIVPNALFGGIHESNNSHVNVSEITYQHNFDSTARNTSDSNTTAVTNGTEEHPSNETSVDIQNDGKITSEITPLPHHLKGAIASDQQQDSKLTNLTETIIGDNVQENQTSIADNTRSNISTVNESLDISENAAESLNETTHLHLKYKSPLGIFDNSTSSNYKGAEEFNVVTEHVDAAGNEAIYRQAVKSNSSTSSFEDESIANVHFSKTTQKENIINVTEAPADQLQDPYVAQASNETLVFKPSPTPSNRTNTLLGSFSSIVSSLLKQEDNESSSTAQTTKETELIPPNLPEGFNVLLEDLVGEYPGEVQFNTISYLNFNNDVVTESTTVETQDDITHSPELEFTLPNETQLIGEDTKTLNDSQEAINQLQGMSDFSLKNLTAEGNLTLTELGEKNDSKIIENLNTTTITSQQISSQEEEQLPIIEHNDTTALTTENRTKPSLPVVDPEINVNETEAQPIRYSHSESEESTFEEINSDPHKKIQQVTKFDDEVTEEISTKSTTLNATSSIDSQDDVSHQNTSNGNASTAKPDIGPTTAPTSVLLTTLHFNTAQETSTQVITSYSGSEAILNVGNDTLQTANDSVTEDNSTTTRPDGKIAPVTSASTTHQLNHVNAVTTVKSPNEFFYHSNNFDTGFDSNLTLPQTTDTPDDRHNITEPSESHAETSTIVEDLDDTLEMILNLSKTYALTHPRPPAFDKSQNKTDEELVSGTLPSEVEAKIAEIIRQAQAGLISGQAPSHQLNHTLPHFIFEQNDNDTFGLNRNQTGTSDSDYEYDAADDSEVSQPIPPNLLAHLGSLFNSSWTSQIAGDVHRDQFHKFSEVSNDSQSNESIINDLHQMFIPLVGLTHSLQATEAVPALATTDGLDADTPLPKDSLSSQPTSSTESHISNEITTLFPRQSITHNETPPKDEEVGVDDSHRPLAPTEPSSHFIEHQTEAHTTETVAHASDQWQNQGESQDEGGHFALENDESFKDVAAENHQSFEGVQGHSDNEDVFSHAVAADDDEKSYFSADDFETGANRHEVESSGEVSAADSKFSADEVNVKEDSEHNDALLETTHLAHEPDSIADWQDEQIKPEEPFEYDNSQSELSESDPPTTTEPPTTSSRTTTTEVPQRSSSTTSSNSQADEVQPQEETETSANSSVEKSVVTETVSEVRDANATTEATTKLAGSELRNEEIITSETLKAEVTTQALATKTVHGVDIIEAAKTEASHKDKSTTDDAWIDLGGESNADPTERSTTEHRSTTARNIPKDHATNFFTKLSNFFSQAVANAGLRQQVNDRTENKSGSTEAPESDDNRSGFGSHNARPTQDDLHRVTPVDATKSEENPDFPEAGFLRKDAASSGHHSLVTEVITAQHGNPQLFHPGSDTFPQTAEVLPRQPSESSPLLHNFDKTNPQSDQQQHDSGEPVTEVFQSPFVASEVITTPDPNAFVGLVSKGSIVFENVLPLSRRGRPTTDERTGQALPTPRKSSAIENDSTEESALAPEDVRVIPFLPEDAITDELHKEPVKPNLAPRNDDKEVAPAAEDVEPITRTPLTQDLNSMTVRVSATSSFKVENTAGHGEVGSVGVAVPISPEGEELAPISEATQRTSTSSVTTEAFPDLKDGSAAATTLQPPAEETEAGTVSSSTTQQATSTSSTAAPTPLSADTIHEDSGPLLEHHVTEAIHEPTSRPQSTRTNKNDDQGVFNIQSAPNFQQTPDYCVEEGEVFQDGERIPTSDFCAQCRCNRGEIQCQHVSCPQRPPGCIEKVVPSSCCPAFLCNETGLIQDGESGLPLRSGITIHGGFVPIERPMVPHEHHVPAFEGTQSHAETPSADESHGPGHSQSSQETEVTEAISHVVGGEVAGHESAPAEQTAAPMQTPEPQRDPLPSSIHEGPSRGTTTESSGIFGGLLESIFGDDKTEDPPAGLSDEEAISEVKAPENKPEIPEVDRTGTHEEPDVQPPTSTSSTTELRPASRRTTEASPTTEGTTKAQEAPAGLWPMLKVSSCNIYGRVYQVGSKIGVLSGPCKECKCTSGGVECYRIKCF